MSVFSLVNSKLDAMKLGNDEHSYAHEQVVSELSDEERDLYWDECEIAEKLYLSRGIGTIIPPEEYEAAFRAAGIVDNR